MASQPPSGTGLMSADRADPEPGSGTPPEPNPASRAKRRRGDEAQPTRPSLTGSQLDATTDAPASAEGPATSTASAPTGSATGSVLAALAEGARQYEARKDVFLTIAQSVDSVVASFGGSRKQIAKEATCYVIQALKRLINHETSPIAARSWAAVAAPMANAHHYSCNTTAATRSGQTCQSSARPKAPLPAQDQPQAQPKEEYWTSNSMSCTFSRPYNFISKLFLSLLYSPNIATQVLRWLPKTISIISATVTIRRGD